MTRSRVKLQPFAMDARFQDLLARAYQRRGFLMSRPQVDRVEMSQVDGGIQLEICEQSGRCRIEMMLPADAGVDYGMQAA